MWLVTPAVYMFQSESISCPKWAEIPFFFFKTSCRMKINTHRLSWMKRSDFSYSTGPWSVSRRVNCQSCGTSNGGIQSLSRHLPCFLLLFVCVVWLLQPDVSGCPWCLPIESLWRWTATADHESAWPNVNIELCLGGGGDCQSGPGCAHLFTNDSEKLNNIYCCHGVVQCKWIINTFEQEKALL